MKKILLSSLLFFFIICQESNGCFDTLPKKVKDCYSAELEESDTKCCFHEMKCDGIDCRDFNGNFCLEIPIEKTDSDELEQYVKDYYSSWNVYGIKVRCEGDGYDDSDTRNNSFYLKIGLLFMTGLLF